MPWRVSTTRLAAVWSTVHASASFAFRWATLFNGKKGSIRTRRSDMSKDRKRDGVGERETGFERETWLERRRDLKEAEFERGFEREPRLKRETRLER